MSLPGFEGVEDIEWSFKSLDSMSALEFYELLKLRIDIFVVEQQCVYAELDAADKASGTLHVQGRLKKSGQLLACARILTGSVATKASPATSGRVNVGRVAVAKERRGCGVAKELMLQVLRYITAELDAADVQLSAQTYIEGFYQNLGFVRVSGEYLEDGIPHLYMVLKELELKKLLESH